MKGGGGGGGESVLGMEKSTLRESISGYGK